MFVFKSGGGVCLFVFVQVILLLTRYDVPTLIGMLLRRPITATHIRRETRHPSIRCIRRETGHTSIPSARHSSRRSNGRTARRLRGHDTGGGV
jgi:hypothetical protein